MRVLAASLAWLAAVAVSAAAQETASDTLLTVDHYLDWEQVADPRISPDGSQIIYTRRWVNKVEDKWESALWIMSADGSHHRFLVKGSDARRPSGDQRASDPFTRKRWREPSALMIQSADSHLSSTLFTQRRV